MSIRIWESLPEEYRAAADPEAPVRVWRGDFVGREVTGTRCKLDQALDPEELVYSSLFAKYPSIRTLVKRHCNNSVNTPFISLTGQTYLAEQFASGVGETIYELALPAHRLVVDPQTGSDSPLIEVLAIGSIEPADIVAVRLGNDPVEWDRSMSWVQ